MSRTSFPRPEHVELLRERIAEYLQMRNLRWELVERPLDQYRCRYRFALRPEGAAEWREVAIHFQVAERMGEGETGSELRRIIDPHLDAALDDDDPEK